VSYACGVLVPARRLLARLRQVPSRAAELTALGRRLAAERAVRAGAEERAVAATMRALKERLAALTAAPACCTRCAAGRPWPGGAFAGGHCCSGSTADIFVDDEVAALAQAGTRPRDLSPPVTEHAGCAFRGATGCTLAAGDRPSLCGRYLCDELRAALHADGRLDEIEAVTRALDDAYARFRRLRAARLDQAWLDEVADEVQRMAGRR
jgi:hypothetical protein